MVMQQVKLNEQFTADGTHYIRRPYSFFHGALGENATPSERMIAGKIFSLACSEARECRYTYKRFQDELGVSRSTVARAIGRLKEGGIIAQDKRRTGAAYKFVKLPDGRSAFLRTERWMLETAFEIGTKGGETVVRRLRQSEIDVLSLIWTHCTSSKTGGTCTGSASTFAGILGYCDDTIKQAIRTLLHAGLITRAEEDRGVNGYKKSTYRINGRVVRKIERAARRAAGAADRRTDAEKAADVKAERERFYAARREAAESRAERYFSRIMQDAAYARAEHAGKALMVKIARAELYSPADVARLQEEAKKLEAEKAARLRAMGIRAEDLTPRYTCPHCKDTGYLPGGKPCGCYTPQG